MTAKELDMDYSKYDFKDSTELYVYLSKKGLSRGTVEEISKMKSEPDWMLDFRLRSYDVFMSKPMPNWGGDLSHILIFKIFIIMLRLLKSKVRAGMMFQNQLEIPLKS